MLTVLVKVCLAAKLQEGLRKLLKYKLLWVINTTGLTAFLIPIDIILFDHVSHRQWIVTQIYILHQMIKINLHDLSLNSSSLH